jgi:hypothetical protein
LWRAITARFEVDSPHEHAVLVEACCAADRLDSLRTTIDAADLADAHTIRLLAEERQTRTALARLLLGQLGLPSGVTDEDGVPVRQTPRSRRARKAANTRWSNPTSESTGNARRAAAARWGRQVAS